MRNRVKISPPPPSRLRLAIHNQLRAAFIIEAGIESG